MEDFGAVSKRNPPAWVAIVLLAATPALASGFGFYEQSARTSAQGGAWVADDAAANWDDPAALAHPAGREVQLGLDYLEAGNDARFSPVQGISFEAVGVVTPVHFYASHRINDRVAWGVDFRNLAVEAGNPAASTDVFENWKETWSYRLRIAVRLGKENKNELRTGGVIDESPVPVQYLRPSIPDADRAGYTLGYGYPSKCWGIDVYAMQLDFDDVTANGSPLDGAVNGTYTSSILLAGATFSYRF